MLEPIKDLWNAEALPGVLLLSGGHLIGEVHGRLFTEEEEVDFQDRGGARYVSGYRLTGNHMVDLALPEKDRQTRFSVRKWTQSRLWRQTTSRLENLWRKAVFAFPPLRLGFPTVNPGSVNVSPRSRRGNATECVTALAFHPRLPLLALAVVEGGPEERARVIIADVAPAQTPPFVISCVLTHAFQRRVGSMIWKPHSEDVLAVGCDSGVLLWSLEAGIAWRQGLYRRSDIICGQAAGDRIVGPETPSTFAEVEHPQRPPLSQRSREARCLFYRYVDHIPVTALSFSHANGQFLACGSRSHNTVRLLDVHVPPCDVSCSMKLAANLDGGSEVICIAGDDSYVLSLTCGHPSLMVLPLRLEDSRHVSTEAICISTPFPVVGCKPAPGVGPHFFFMQLSGTEGLIVAQIDVFSKAVHVVSMIGTTMVRGIGGLVRTFAASKRRLWVATETGHFLICDYHSREELQRRVSVIPIGVAAMDVTAVASFEGFPVGSLAAVIEEGDVLHLVPSYHA